MNTTPAITPVRCPDTNCYWAAHGIPDRYAEARAWHLAAHRADTHNEPLTAEQIAYAKSRGHRLPDTQRDEQAAAEQTSASAGDELAMQALSDAGAVCGVCGDQPGDRKCPDCEECYREYVAALRAAGWAPRAEVAHASPTGDTA